MDSCHRCCICCPWVWMAIYLQKRPLHEGDGARLARAHLEHALP